MEILIFAEKQRKDRYYLKLEYFADSVSLFAVDEKGDRLPKGHLLNISSYGIIRSLNVSDKLGLSLDDKGRIVDI